MFVTFTIASCYICRVVRLGMAWCPRARKAAPWLMAVSAPQRIVLTCPASIVVRYDRAGTCINEFQRLNNKYCTRDALSHTFQ